MAHNPSSGMKQEDHKIKISLNYIIKIKAHAWRKRQKEEEKEGRKVRRKDGRKENKKRKKENLASMYLIWSNRA